MNGQQFVRVLHRLDVGLAGGLRTERAGEGASDERKSQNAGDADTPPEWRVELFARGHGEWFHVTAVRRRKFQGKCARCGATR